MLFLREHNRIAALLAKEYDVGRYWLESRLLKIAPVSQEMVLNYLGEHVLYALCCVLLLLPAIFGGHRLGCLLAGCCFGKPTDVAWAVTFTDPVEAVKDPDNRAKLLLETLDRDGKISPTYPYPVQVWKLGPDVTFPPMPDPPPGYVTRIRVERVSGVGPWAQG